MDQATIPKEHRIQARDSIVSFHAFAEKIHAQDVVTRLQSPMSADTMNQVRIQINSKTLQQPRVLQK